MRRRPYSKRKVKEYDILDLEQIVVLSIIIFFPKILSIVLTVPVVQKKLQNLTNLNAKGIMKSGQ